MQIYCSAIISDSEAQIKTTLSSIQKDYEDNKNLLPRPPAYSFYPFSSPINEDLDKRLKDHFATILKNFKNDFVAKNRHASLDFIQDCQFPFWTKQGADIPYPEGRSKQTSYFVMKKNN